MKNNYILYLIMFLAGLHIPCIYPESIITFFMQPYPSEYSNDVANSVQDKLQKPGKSAKYSYQGLAYPDRVSGIFSTYAGYITTSGVNGQTSFPRKQAENELNLFITPALTPVTMVNATLQHWELEQGTPVACYKASKQQDSSTLVYFWNVEKIKAPKNNIIPLDTIVIFAKPHYIYVPIGVTPTHDSPNLVLPPLYIKKGIKNVHEALYVMNIKHYFAPIRFQYKKEPTGYLRIID